MTSPPGSLASASLSRWRLRRHLTPTLVLWVFVGLSTILGLTGFNRYGESWDERVDFNYGEAALAYYSGPADYWETYDLRHYGPAYLALAHVASSYLPPLFPSWETTDARHFVNHLTFQIATVALFYLCLRYMAGWPALGATLLFATQPLLFGHSFINQKDIPFMTAYLAAAALGFGLGSEPAKIRTPSGGLLDGWTVLSGKGKTFLLGFVLVSVLVIFELLFLKAIFLPAAKGLVAAAYTGHSFPLLNDWFLRAAQNAPQLPLEAYLDKTTRLYMFFRWSVVALAVAACAMVLGRVLRPDLSRLRGSRASALLLALAGGAVAGLTTATRVLGLSVIALVALPLFVERRWSRLPLLAVYAGSAAVVCFAAWPFLHGAPLAHLWESLVVMSRYPWSGGILFMGQIYGPESLPWFYLPVLLGIQLTLPAIFLGLAGLGMGLRQVFRGRKRGGETLALIVWLVAPVLVVVALGSTLYNNFRQLLFVLPPLFVFGGIALDFLLVKIGSPVASAVAMALLLVPGILGIAQLHPYEYVYYNRLVGGVRGAFRSYEMDYWCTSYREAMDWINDVAPVQATIAAAPPELVAANFARADLRVIYAQLPDDLVGQDAVLGLGCGRGNNDLGFFPAQPAVAEVTVEGARLSVIRDLQAVGNMTGE